MHLLRLQVRLKIASLKVDPIHLRVPPHVNTAFWQTGSRPQ